MSIIKLAAKKHEEIARYTPGGAIMSGWLPGAMAAGIASPAISNAVLKTTHGNTKAALAAAGATMLAGHIGGLAAGIHHMHKLKESGEFKKKVLPNKSGTKTGWGSYGSSLAGPIGYGIYHLVKNKKHAKLEDND